MRNKRTHPLFPPSNGKPSLKWGGMDNVLPELKELGGRRDIQLSTRNYHFPRGNIGTLDRVLTRLELLRPYGFSQIPSITFVTTFGDTEREGGSVGASGNIDIYNGFAPPSETADAFRFARYADDSRELATSADTETYLLNMLAHEMGHIDKHPDVFSFYEEHFSRHEDRYHHGDRYAEDYRIFLISGGERVARRDMTGNEIPRYQERLELFRKHIKLNMC